MNYLWAFMILSGVIFSAFHGTIPAVTGAVLDSAKEAVTLCITMTGVMSFWMGLMRIDQFRLSHHRLAFLISQSSYHMYACPFSRLGYYLKPVHKRFHKRESHPGTL